MGYTIDFAGSPRSNSYRYLQREGDGLQYPRSDAPSPFRRHAVWCVAVLYLLDLILSLAQNPSGLTVRPPLLLKLDRG